MSFTDACIWIILLMLIITNHINLAEDQIVDGDKTTDKFGCLFYFNMYQNHQTNCYSYT